MNKPAHPNILEGKAKEEVNQSLKKNVIITMLTTIFYLLTRLVIPPLTLKYISLSEYGLWSYCFIIIGYLAMGAFGVTNVYIRFAARFAALNDEEKINKLLSTGILTIGTLSLLFMPVFYLLMPWVLHFFNIGDALAEKAFYLIMGTLVIFSIDQTFAAYGYILHSLQQIKKEKTFWTLGIVVELVLIVVFFYFGFGVYTLLLAYFCRTLVSLAGYAISCYQLMPNLKFSIRNFDFDIFKLFLNFGGIVQLSSCLGIINRSVEKVFAGSFLGLSATGLYEVGQKFPVTSLSIPSSITAVLFPAASHLHTKEEHEHIKELYLKSCKEINLISGSIMGFLCVFATPIIAWWLGNKPEYAIAATIMAIFTLPYQFDVLTGPASAVFRAKGEPLKELFYGVLQLVLTVGATLSWLLLQGPSFTIINWGVSSMMCLSALIYFYYANSQLLQNQLEFLKKALIPGLIPYAVAYIVSNFFNFPLDGGRWRLFFMLSLCFTVYAITLMIIYFVFVLSNDEKKAIIAKIKFKTIRG